MNRDNDDHLKKEIIKTLMMSKYKNNTDDHDQIIKDLQLMNITDLDLMLNNYYLYEIKNKK